MGPAAVNEYPAPGELGCGRSGLRLAPSEIDFTSDADGFGEANSLFKASLSRILVAEGGV